MNRMLILLLPAVVIALPLSARAEPAGGAAQAPVEFKFQPPKDAENPADDPPWLYGMHDWTEDCAKALADAGLRGWFVEAVGLGRDPGRMDSHDWSGIAGRGLGLICRLNYGFGPQGTIPHAKYYEDFAKRCGNFVAGSKGCHVWVIGNETNLREECPTEEGGYEAITPENYARCFKLCRKAIHAGPGHEKDQVILQALAPWNDGKSTGQGDWLTQFRRIMAVVGNDVDGFAIHVYSWEGHDPSYIRGTFFQTAYRQILAAVPRSLVRLPAYVTELGARDWKNENNGWVKAAYADLNAWNQTGAPKIRAACIYRWSGYVADKRGIFDDWKESLKAGLHWTTRKPLTAPELKALEDKQRAEWERKRAKEAEKKAAAEAGKAK